jgi:hypothetical protein
MAKVAHIMSKMRPPNDEAAKGGGV